MKFINQATQNTLTSLVAIGGTIAAIAAPTSEASAQMQGDPDVQLSQVRTEIEDLEDDTYGYEGETVTVRGELDEFLAPNIIVLEEDEEFLEMFENDSVLVVSDNIPKVTAGEGRDLRVVGEVRELSVAEVERDYSFDFDDFAIRNEVEYEYEGRPVIYADSVEVVDY